MTYPTSPIIVALDFSTAQAAVNLAKTLDPTTVRVKVGKELFVNAGPVVVEQLQTLGFEVFLDLKFHDIPNTVAQACLAVANLGVWMTNVHASGGALMMQHVMQTLTSQPKRPLITAVTVLTSMNAETLQTVGVARELDEQVLQLAKLTQQNDLDGVVCSAQEAPRLRKQLGKDFLLVTPGIRLANHGDDDQHRVVTPAQAIANGSDYLVIGRPITQAKKPQQTVEKVLAQID